ncbi:efflux transporter periplasmic adaptor subunit [Limnohabitans sp. MMS-10A-160]|uniref:efflux RND transporter periplasmic adaptor subunit n=1 Tax=unclassified Limnohabitans TaxID=2626134 RepID=UPI000D38D28D|nr:MULTISPECIES: efflux RND transporter periplasmic adaptor subunit [unclassified Limnohabitans]PUE19047.1 efflux transporter periplasmic adaptor subunit [Limnohabitans sp. MMS-10A-192]PUE24348.1 efflux transporter periplasmic adaptor subunit [Limnohabitans sp. MMS-10A-160]
MAYQKKYVLIAVIGVCVASGVAWWAQRPSSGDQTPSAATAPGAARAPAVEVAKVTSITLVDEAQSVGSLRSRQGVMLRPEVAGRVAKILFNDGQRVSKGQLLVQLDDQLQAAQLSQAKAEMSIAAANHKRNQELVAQNFISKRSLDESAAALEVAQAKLDLAQATLQRLKIIAPFNGVTGLRQINVGDYLKDGADVVNIEDIDAVLVDFRLPERFQAKVRAGQSAQLTLDALPGRSFAAVVQAVDPLIDANGRSVGVRGCIDNRQQQLRPGMFARVNAVFGSRPSALVIPEEAIVPQGGRTFVVKVIPGDKPETLISQRVPVKVGLRQPGKVEILEGLELDDTVVVAGHQRLQKDGTPVRVVDMSRPASGKPVAGAAPSASTPAVAAVPPASSAGLSPAGVVNNTGNPNVARAAPAAKPLSGPNPCLRGADATR